MSELSLLRGLVSLGLLWRQLVCCVVTSWEMQAWDSGVAEHLLRHVVLVGVDAEWPLEVSSSASCSELREEETRSAKAQAEPLWRDGTA